MSREERRAYQRQMRGMDRGPALPPAARARAERVAARRQERRAKTQPSDGKPGATFTARFWIRALLIAVAAGYVAFSIQWNEGLPRALYVGVAAFALVLVLSIAFRFVQRRMPTRP